MIDKRRAEPEILCRSQPTEFSKFVDEVSLVEVTEGKPYIHPVHDGLALHRLDDLSKSVQTMKAFRRQANFLPKYFYEMALAVAGFVRDFSG